MGVIVAGAPALRLDLTLAPGASRCPDGDGRSSVLMSLSPHPYPGAEWRPALDAASRMRLYLVDLPEGSSMRFLAIAIVAPQSRFEHVTEAATPIVESVRFRAP